MLLQHPSKVTSKKEILKIIEKGSKKKFEHQGVKILEDLKIKRKLYLHLLNLKDLNAEIQQISKAIESNKNKVYSFLLSRRINELIAQKEDAEDFLNETKLKIKELRPSHLDLDQLQIEIKEALNDVKRMDNYINNLNLT